MPLLEINTNVDVPHKKELAVKASNLVASLLGKDENVTSPQLDSG
jgi:phenylpyruvate tautomerase PptA (4-oxalocrotonate tautomerase family)